MIAVTRQHLMALVGVFVIPAIVAATSALAAPGGSDETNGSPEPVSQVPANEEATGGMQEDLVTPVPSVAEEKPSTGSGDSSLPGDIESLGPAQAQEVMDGMFGVIPLPPETTRVSYSYSAGREEGWVCEVWLGAQRDYQWVEDRAIYDMSASGEDAFDYYTQSIQPGWGLFKLWEHPQLGSFITWRRDNMTITFELWADSRQQLKVSRCLVDGPVGEWKTIEKVPEDIDGEFPSLSVPEGASRTSYYWGSVTPGTGDSCNALMNERLLDTTFYETDDVPQKVFQFFSGNVPVGWTSRVDYSDDTGGSLTWWKADLIMNIAVIGDDSSPTTTIIFFRCVVE